jgi:hypothetical protein
MGAEKALDIVIAIEVVSSGDFPFPLSPLIEH